MDISREGINFLLALFAVVMLAIPSVAYIEQLPEIIETIEVQVGETKQGNIKEQVNEKDVILPKDEQIVQAFLSVKDLQILREAKQKDPLTILTKKTKELDSRGVLVE